MLPHERLELVGGDGATPLALSRLQPTVHLAQVSVPVDLVLEGEADQVDVCGERDVGEPAERPEGFPEQFGIVILELQSLAPGGGPPTSSSLSLSGCPPFQTIVTKSLQGLMRLSSPLL